MPTSIRLLRGSAAEWAANDLVLPAGEPALCTDDHTLRIGDGVSPFSALPLYRDASPNLLLNADFRLLRNSRARTVYNDTSISPCIDAWNKQANGEVRVVDGGIALSANEGYVQMYQPIEHFEKRLLGRTVTLSTIANGTLHSFTYPNIQFDLGQFGDFMQISCNGPSFFSLYYDKVYLYARFVVLAGHPLTVEAVKLELGSASTLAISRDSEPAFTELACNRLFRTSYPRGVAPGTPAAAYPCLDRKLSDGLLQAEVRFGHPMRIAPTVTCYSSATGAPGMVWDEEARVDRPVILDEISPRGFTYSVPSMSPGHHLAFHYTASAEMV